MNANAIRVKADGKVLPYTMYIGESISKGGKTGLSFEAITQSITKEPYI
ncbi:MAG: hypothetical protein H9893_12160 [Candidatus Niameybacter stercoravium]|nr:hypothetical protein [Candidatus Niameybacter stercoravium]